MSGAKRNLESGKSNASSGLVWKKNTPAIVPCVWSDIAVSDLRLAIDAVTRAGGAIMLGLTSDGGAYSICVLYGTDKIKEYPHSAEECAAVLGQLVETFADVMM